MRKYLLPDKKQYKANMHCHSTLSDGRLTVEQLKDAYKSHGYSILAYSDHNKLIPHNDLRDDAFLPITSIEIDMTEYAPNWLYARTYHINFFSKDADRTEFIHVDRAYDYKVANDMIERAAAEGFVAQYNHPRWSLQQPDDFLPLKGLKLFETFNTGCEIEMANGYGDYEYELMLTKGSRVLPSCTDDNHDATTDFDSPYNDSFGGFNMICMDKLGYDEFFDAIENGDMYASTSPEIKALYVEDGKIHIECSPAKTIMLRTDGRLSGPVHSNNCDLTSHDFAIPADTSWKYLRFEVWDNKGKAFTRAYDVSEIR